MARIRTMVLLILLFTSFTGSVLAQGGLPTLTGVVTDLTQTLSYDEMQEITQQEQLIVQSAGLHRMYVLLTPNLYGYGDSSQFGRDVFSANQLGTGDVLITIEFETHALVLTNSTELDSYFRKNSPNCVGDWGTYIVSDLMPGYLGNGEFKNGIIAGMQEVGSIITQPATACQVEPSVGMPANSVPQQTETQPESNFNWALCLFVIVVLLLVLLILYLVSRRSGGGNTYTTYTPRSPSYSWPSADTKYDYSPRPVSRPSTWSSPSTGGSSSRSSMGSGGSSSRSSFSPSRSSSSSRSGKW